MPWAWRFRRNRAVWVVAALLGVATPIFIEWAIERDDAVGRADAIVVLSSAFDREGRLSRISLDRLERGIELATRDTDALIVTTRVTDCGRRPDGQPHDCVLDQRRHLVAARLASRWKTVDGVASTRDEAVGTLRLLGAQRRLIVVTSPLHTRRACRTFERVGFRVTCVSTRHRYDWFTLPRELAATVWYTYQGWI